VSGPLGFLSGIIGPIGSLVDNLHTSAEEKGAIKIALDTMHKELVIEGLKLEKSLAEARSSIIVAEANSESWITRSWRPLMMLMFGVLICLISTGLMDVEALAAVPDRLWTLMSIGIGGYITSRGAEKIVPVIGAMKKKDHL
tara:strand:+ start:239 stop:664 length:426 start_codon:yes stop_codon:yes gene_type:complete